MSAPGVTVDVRVDATGRFGALLEEAVARGESALQVSVVVAGECVVDVAAGRGGPDGVVTVDSLLPVFSATKGVVALAVLDAVADDLLDLDEPLAEVWPTFTGGGKEAVTLRHVLTHASGLPQMPSPCSVAQMCSWDTMVELLEGEPLLWQPGRAGGYHAYTYGWLAGEPLRRTDPHGARPGGVVKRRVAEPAGARDFWLGLPDEQHGRVVTLEWDGPPLSQEGLRARALPAHLEPGQAVYGRADVRRAETLGAGGISTARSLAQIYCWAAAQALGDTAFGALLREATSVHRHETDVVLGAEVSRGLGFRVSDPDNGQQAFPFDAASSSFGHPGAGGTLAWGDVRHQAGFALTRGRMTARGYADPSVAGITAELQAVVAG